VIFIVGILPNNIPERQFVTDHTQLPPFDV